MLSNREVIAIYLLIFLVIYYKFRSTLEISGPLLLKRTKKGTNLLWDFGQRYKRIITIIGDIGIVVSFIAMFIGTILMLHGVLSIFTTKGVPSPTITPVIPGIKISGAPYLPLIEGIIVIASVVVIHEFSHGLLAAASNIKPKSLWLFILFILPGAGVELDEYKIMRTPLRTRLKIYAAGSFANILFALFMLLVVSTIFTKIVYMISEPVKGVVISGVSPGFPAEKSGIKKGDIILMVNNFPINNFTDFTRILNHTHPNETIEIRTTRGRFNVTLTSHPNNNDKGYMGILVNLWSLRPKKVFKPYLSLNLDKHVLYIMNIINLFVILHLSIGIINLLPVFPLDGGRMIIDIADTISSEKAIFITKLFASLCVFIFLLNLLGPYVIKYFGPILS